MKQAIYKVPNGKLLKVFLEEKDSKIADIKITGDFFMHPEEKITLLEDSMRGEALEEDILRKKLESYLDKEGIELFGADAESIAKTIMMASSVQL